MNTVIVERIRAVAAAMIASNQISLELGSDGGGQGATPWCEESGEAFPRLEFKLVEGKIQASSDEEVIATCEIDVDLPISWVEKVMAKWILVSVQKLRANG